MRKKVYLTILGLFLLGAIPLVAIAQDEIVELMFTDGGATIGIVETIVSSADVSVEVNGVIHQIKVPVTIAIDTTLPLSSSIVAVESTARVGTVAVEMKATEEFTEMAEISMPSHYGGVFAEEFEPTSEDHKIVGIFFNITNLGDAELSVYALDIKGVDDLGRLFNPSEQSCQNVNPGESGACVVIFDDIAKDGSISALDIEVKDRRRIPAP